MTELYVVSGFLGAGKTTFLKRFIALFEKSRLSVIVNEFGQENVDEKLLAELNVAVKGVSGGSIFCACRLDQFEKALSDALLTAPDVILVETSGLSDPTGIRRVLKDRPEFQDIAYKGCVLLADATRLYKLYETARVIRKQLTAADIVLMNKTDVATADQLNQSMRIAREYVEEQQIFRTVFADPSPDLLRALNDLRPGREANALITADIQLHSLTLTVSPAMTLPRFSAFLDRFIAETYRIKGFLSLDGASYLVDCVGSMKNIAPANGADTGDNRLVVLYGYGQKAAKRVREAAAGYPDEISEIEVH